jgi:hypothetical protein
MLSRHRPLSFRDFCRASSQRSDQVLKNSGGEDFTAVSFHDHPQSIPAEHGKVGNIGCPHLNATVGG